MFVVKEEFELENIPSLEKVVEEFGLFFGPEADLFTADEWHQLASVCARLGQSNCNTSGTHDTESFVEYRVKDSKINYDENLGQGEDYYDLGTDILKIIEGSTIEQIAKRLVNSGNIKLKMMNVNSYNRGHTVGRHSHSELLTVVIVPRMSEEDNSPIIFEKSEQNNIEVPLKEKCIYFALGEWEHGSTKPFTGPRDSIGLFFDLTE